MEQGTTDNENMEMPNSKLEMAISELESLTMDKLS